MARYLITGIAGFIGSSLAHELLRLGHTVRGIDNFSTGSVENVRPLLRHAEITRADINDPSALRECCRGADYVLHQAALASVPRSVEDPESSHATNVNGTLNVLLAARDAGVQRVVYAASSSAYGDQPTQPKREDMLPCPLSPYAAQKLAGEQYVRCFWHVYGLEGVCLRYFNVFGPRQSADSPYSGVIARFVTSMMEGVTPTVFGSGRQSRDFTYVSNVVTANLLACAAPREQVAGEVFNIGTGQSHTIESLRLQLASLIDFKGGVRRQPARRGDVEHSQAEICKAQSALGYQPAAGFHEGLAKTVEWYQERATGARAVPARPHPATAVAAPGTA